MIEEDYVSLETAKLLEEKGFDWDCKSKKFYPEPDYDQESPNGVYAPTLQRTIKWLEEVHHILVVADYIYECTDTSWVYKIYRLGENGKPERVEITGVRYGIDGEPYVETVGYRDYELSHKDYTTREEAEDEGIRYVLKKYV